MSNQAMRGGKLSVERPWMKYYPEEIQHISVPYCSLMDYFTQNIKDSDTAMIHYYGCELSWNDVLTKVDITANALKQLGCEVGSIIPLFLQSVPEFVLLLLAAEKIGAQIVCRDGTADEKIEVIKQCKSKILFTHDYLSKEEENQYYEQTHLQHIIVISPFNMADKSKMPNYIIDNIESRYADTLACNRNTLTWQQVEALGQSYQGNYEVVNDPSRPLYSAYTSGSTGPSKQVIHSAANIIGIMHQTAVFTAGIPFRLSWLLTCLPPALVAVTVAMILTPMATNKLLILDPFCAVDDIDLELMRYNPNCWALIPQFVDVLVNSTRIPEDYSIVRLFAVGSGAEALNNQQIRNMQKFLKDHNFKAFFSVGYGMSEGGSGFTMPCEAVSIENCCCGIPMPATTLAIFDPDTKIERDPREIGEICKSGPGIMLRYQDIESSKEVLQYHDDGKLWMHTGDFGYMTEEGQIYVLSRGLPERFGGGYLFAVPMENKVVEVKGVKDGFFVIVPDTLHEGYFLPYLYIVLEEGVTLHDVEKEIRDRLDAHEQPVEIRIISKRPFFHFKTNRKGLAAEILKANELSASML